MSDAENAFRNDLRAAIRFVVGSESRGISLSNLVADLQDVEVSVTKWVVADEIDHLLAGGEITSTGAKRTGDRRFHVASPAQDSRRT